MKRSGTKTSLPSTSNYMKSTASVDARREQSKVSRKIHQTSPDYNSTFHSKGSTNNSSKDGTERLARTTSLKIRTLKKRIPSFKKETAEVKKDSTNSTNICSNSKKGVTERLARTSSFKMRTLKKKNPSFKAEIAEVEKGSTNSSNICSNSSKGVTFSLKMRTLKKKITCFKKETAQIKEGSTDVLCENLLVKRATCSSTLKDRKFPDYLKQSRGGTESEGTSGVKVCSYSRCSLHGHQHALMAPVKSIVSARRRVLKTERGIKLRCQSPKARPTGGSPNCTDIDPGFLGNLSNGEMCCDIDHRDNLEDFMIKSEDKFGSCFDEISVSKESFEREDLNELFFKGNETSGIDTQSGNTMTFCNAMDREEHDLNDESLPNEDASTEMGSQASYISESLVEEITNWVGSATIKGLKHDQDHMANVCSQAEYFSGASTKDLTNERYPAKINVVHEVNPRNMAFPETEEKSSTLAAVNCEKSNQESDESRHINPHELHFLPLEPDPQAENVNFDEESLNELFFEGNEIPRIGPQSGNTLEYCNVMDREVHDLNDESLPNEYASTEKGSQTSHLSKGLVEEITNWVDSATSKAIKHDQDHVVNVCNQAEYFSGASENDLTNETYLAECKVVHEVNHRNMAMPETEEKSLVGAAVKCEKSYQESDEPRFINPQGLHFLPLEPDPEAENVNLRHQELLARKNAEEWMVDYALREAVTRISPARQRKVPLLVKAFEEVLPTSKS